MDQSTLTVLTAFVVVTALAVVIQMGVLVALFLSVKKTSAQVQNTLEQANAVLTDSRARITETVANVAAISSRLRSQLDRFDVTFGDAMDRTQRQVIRADNLLNRTMDHVEVTTEVLHEGVLAPVRRLAGLVQGLTVGIDTFFKLTRKAPPHREHAPVSHDEEMFI